MIDAAFRAALADALAPVAAELRAQRGELARLRDALALGRWVDRSEASDALGVSVATIDRMLRDGQLRSQRVGKRGVRVLLEAPPTDAEISRMATEARR